MSSRKSEKSSAPVKPKPKADWSAIERDYRTGKYTLRELAAKHGSDHGLISRKAKKLAWAQDLTVAIKQATNSKLVTALITKKVNNEQQKTVDVVLAAAELNASIIQSQRARLTSLTEAVESAQHKVLAFGDTVGDIREAATFAQAVGNLAAATKTLIEQERKAYSLDDAPVVPEEAQRTVKVTFV